MGRALHGRDADLALIDDTLSALGTGRGRALFLTGEPGIGKSTLLAEARARAGDALVLSGAAWEAGGAVPYWPWVQVLRDAGSHTVLTHAVNTQVTTDGAAARFGLLDSVVRELIALASQRPFVVLLDDLHAADIPTLDLLVMFVRELPRAPIALIAAWRESELGVRADAAQRLARASRFGDVHPVRRLTSEEVAAWVGASAPAVFAASEGNPLFVEELMRARAGAVSSSVTTVIADHLALASPSTRELLAAASVLGRELDATLLAQLGSEDAIASALRDAASVGIVEKAGRGWRFRHILLRDQLYDSLPASRRAELHRVVGDALAAVDPVRAAPHLIAGGSPHAVQTAREAAARASAVYAFEDAAQLLLAALQSVDESSTLAIDLRLELATARHHVGLIDQARADCVKAAEQSRALADHERFARAASVYAMELMSGTRDPMMVALLDEAERKLPAEDSATRARVMARLAAALVPGPDADALRAQDLARAAVAMARRIGDRAALLFTLRYAGHAHAYQIPVEEALAITQEVIAISDELGRPLEAVDHRAWLVGAYLALGDVTAADAALAAFEALLAPLPQPQYRWRAPILRATTATRLGNFDEAERHLAIARAIAQEYALDRAMWASRFGAIALAVTSRDPERARSLQDVVAPLASARVGSGGYSFVAAVSAVAGNHDHARSVLARAVFIPTLLVIQFGAEAAVLVQDRDSAARMLPVLEQQCRLYPTAQGPQGSVFIRPAAMVLGEIYALLGRVDEGIEQLERGLAHARRIHSAPSIALGCACLARILEQRGAASDRDRIIALRSEAARLANACGVHGIDASMAAPRRSNQLALQCDERGATVRWAGRELTLAASRGFEFLATLVSAPGCEVHVSDLIGDDDRGDAGEILDAKARTAYRQRVEELQADLETARARNDLGRAERLAAELEAITDELVGATGLGGRARKAGSRVERARVNVQRRIKDAIRRLAAEDEALGRYLEATVRTGTFCSFVPLDS